MTWHAQSWRMGGGSRPACLAGACTLQLQALLACLPPHLSASPLPACLLPLLLAGFLFDSSISEQYPSATSPSAAERLYPYTMDYGLPQRCDLGTGEPAS